MIKELQTRKTKKTTSTSRRKKSVRTTKPRKTSGRKNLKKHWREVPMWLYYTLTGIVVAILLTGFYFFYIRPYVYRWKACSGARAYGVCLPTGYEVHGFDMSHHQGKIDWETLKNVQDAPYPVRFVFMKASEGGDFRDTTFIHNFEKARKFGFIRGAYHFFNPKTDPSLQADFFIRSVKLEAGDLPPVLDVEKVGEDEAILRKNVRIWLRKIEQHYRVKPILYASYKFKTRYLTDSIFDGYPYWIAHYYADSLEYRGHWEFWQHTDVGRLPGIKEDVDLNVFNGSLEELKAMTIK